MDNKFMKNGEQSFLNLSLQSKNVDRLNRYFFQAIGDEDVSRREASVKHFDMGANRHQAVVYSEPVHFRNSENGEWQEIDNTLEKCTNEMGRQVFRNRANRVQMEFPQETDGGSMAAVTASGKTFAWRFEHDVDSVCANVRSGRDLKQERLVKMAQKMPKYIGRSLSSLQAANLEAEMETEQEKRADIAALCAQNQYDNVLPGVSVRYTLNGESVKEDIILANSDALTYASLRLPKDFDYEVTKEQRLRVLDNASCVELFSMDTPIVYDAAGKETIAEVVLTDCGAFVRMTYVIDPMYLAEASYPVTIDPVIHSTNPVTNIQDTTLGRGSSATPYTENHLKIGKYNNSVDCVSLLKFNTLAIPKACDTIISAVLQMAPKSSSTSKYIGAYEVLKPWESATANWNNFNPESTTSIASEAIECLKGSSNTWLSFDLTNLYRKWCTRNAAGVSNNNGVAFRTPANVSGANYSELYSSDASSSYRPVMYVNYISHAGIEGWWQYEQMSAGRAGTAYADLFNGNMVLEHNDTVMTGNRNPVSVNHYYNSCLSTANSYNCGFGWKTDAHQKVTARTHNNHNYYVWEDGDGTEHFFEATGSQPYKDSEGMDLKLTYTSGSPAYIIITDKEENQMRFNVVQNGLAWLVATRDALDNRAIWTYVTGYESIGRIDKITDPVGRVTQFNYNTNGLISSITIPAAANGQVRTVYYTYDSSKRLIGVRYSELGGTIAHTTYTYDGSTNLLTKARNYDGVQVNVGYETTSLYGAQATDDARRVLSLENVATSTSGSTVKYGAKQLFEYKHMCTEVTAVDSTTSNEGKKLHYQFNDSGNVICVRDDLGYARFTKYESGLENKPSEESPLRKAIINLLRSPDLAANWTTSGTATKDVSVNCMSAPSAKLSAANGESMYRQEIMLEGGKVYTFSAYVKTNAVSGRNGAFLRLRKKSDANSKVESDAVIGSTAAAMNNAMPTDGWERIHVVIDRTNVNGAEAYYADMVLDAANGIAWFSCPQVELGSIVNTVNLVSNGDFRYTYASGNQTLAHEWTNGSNNLTTVSNGVISAGGDSAFPEALSGNYIQVEGRPDKSTYVGYVQNFDLKGKKGDVFVVGGWANAKSMPNANTISRAFAIAMRLKKTDGTWISYYMLPFNTEWVGWQFGSWALVAGYDYTAIDMTLVYTGNCNKAQFSNIFMYREQFGQSFAYDSDGKVVSTSTLAGQKSDIKYDSAKNITSYTQPGRDAAVQDNQYWFYYGSSDADKKKHLLLRSRTPMHMTDYYSYDSYGNTTASRRVDYRVYTNNAAESAYPYIRTENTYSANGNYTATTKDARGNVVTQNVNTNDGTLTSVTDPAGQTVNYSYDASKRVTAVQTIGNGKTYKNGYTYENDHIKTVAHNTTSDTVNDVTYTFGYDDLGRKTTVKVGTQTLSTNVYENDRNGLLSEVQYGNGGKVKYTYDDFDRLTDVKYDNETAPRYAYKYGANGQASEVKDANLGRIVRTENDLSDRPCQVEHCDTMTNELLYQTRLKYDKLGNLAQFAEKVGNETHTSDYTYDRDNRVTEIAYDGTAQKAKYAYDALGRVATREVENGTTVGKLTSTYGYIAGGYGTNSTTPLVASISQSTGAGAAMNFAYTYDNRGNIVSETRNGMITTYAYDALGQLIRVNDPHDTSAGSTGTTWVFNYDRGGNITSKVKYAYTTGTLGTALQTIPYTYGDSNWKDKLTNYNGHAITYDAIGNPTNDGIWSYEWQAGRQLKRMSAEGTAVSFKYDHNGLRVEKVVEQDWYPVTTKYTLHGKLITDMTVDYTDWDEVAQQDKLHFFYDALSRPTKVDYNGIVYTYVHNLQGDIVGLLDNNGALVVEYKYDAWGGLLSTTGSLADTLGKRNPFRYRGYVYDEETELYYLRSRFYCPIKCRFVNADNIMGKKGILFGHNGFAYCKNAPICFNDASGHAWGLILLLAVAVAATLTGCSQNNSSNISQYNCYAYAVGKTVWMNPGGDTRQLKYMRKDKPYKIKQDYFDVYDTAAAVISDLGGRRKCSDC